MSSKQFIKLLLLYFFTICLHSCEGEIVKIDYGKQKLTIKSDEKILIFPSSISKEVSLGLASLKIMYDTILITILKEGGQEIIKDSAIITPEEVKYFLKTKKIELKEIEKNDIKEIDNNIIQELKNNFNPKYFIKTVLLSYQKDDLLGKQNIFISLKIYNTDGEKLLMVNSHYEGENSLESIKVEKIFQHMIKESLVKN